MYINLVLGPKGQKAYRELYNEQTKRMKRIDYINELILGEIAYKNWVFILRSTNDLLFLFAQFVDKDEKSWNTRKYYLSEHMTDSEIVQTAFLCIKTAEEHEMREEFKFKGEAIFGPHFNVNTIASCLADGDLQLDVRQHG